MCSNNIGRKGTETEVIKKTPPLPSIVPGTLNYSRRDLKPNAANLGFGNPAFPFMQRQLSDSGDFQLGPPECRPNYRLGIVEQGPFSSRLIPHDALPDRPEVHLKVRELAEDMSIAIALLRDSLDNMVILADLLVARAYAGVDRLCQGTIHELPAYVNARLPRTFCSGHGHMKGMYVRSDDVVINDGPFLPECEIRRRRGKFLVLAGRFLSQGESYGYVLTQLVSDGIIGESCWAGKNGCESPMVFPTRLVLWKGSEEEVHLVKATSLPAHEGILTYSELEDIRSCNMSRANLSM